ncbi:MAG: hypothetical protein QXR53_01855 [Candidatus Norongarragalinales archaeon]
MDLKIVIRQLLDKGLTREQVITNLKELGVGDAEKLFDEAIATQKPPATQVSPAATPKPQGGLFKEISEEKTQKPVAAAAASPQKRKGELEISVSDLVETQGKSLFKEKEEKKELEEPQVEIVREEKEEEPEEEKEEKIEIPAAGAKASQPETLEEKIDEALALLKALENINQKILDTDRKLLLRSKT